MEYLTASQTAEQWGVSLRQVQRLLADGRITGATKYGRFWMIPSGAEKPADPRREKAPETNLSSELTFLIEAVANPASAADDERIRLIYECAPAYLTGDFARTISCYKTLCEDSAAKLYASSLAIAAAISAGDYPLYLEIEGYLKRVVSENISKEVTAYAELCLATGYLGAAAPGLAPDWLKNGDFSNLHPLTRLDAAYQRARYYQGVGNYEAMLAASQTALSLRPSAKSLTFPDIYLRVVCAMACFPLGRADDAKAWLLDAMNLALPYGFITPFAETMVALGGLVEKCLKDKFPQHYDAVISQWKRTFPSWLSFHDRFTGDNITRILSHREHQLAILAAQAIPYSQIAEHFGMSVGRLNNVMQEICEKLNISSKSDLGKYVLRVGEH